VKQYTVACREQVLRAIDAGLSRVEAADRFGMSVSTIGGWQRRRRGQGNLVPSRRPGRTPLIGPEEREALLAQIHAHPAATVAEHRDRWAEDHQVRVSIGTMFRALKSAGWQGREPGPRGGP
jgi:transposase